MHVIPHSLYLSSTDDGKPQDDNNRLSGNDQLRKSVGLATLHSENPQNTHLVLCQQQASSVLPTTYLVDSMYADNIKLSALKNYS